MELLILYPWEEAGWQMNSGDVKYWKAEKRNFANALIACAVLKA